MGRYCGNCASVGPDSKTTATVSFAEGALLAAGGTVLTSAAVAASPVAGGALAVGAVFTGAYQGTIALQQVITGRDPYTGRAIDSETRIDSAAGLVGGLVGGGLALRGAEITLPSGSRIAPLGNRTGNKKGGCQIDRNSCHDLTTN